MMTYYITACHMDISVGVGAGGGKLCFADRDGECKGRDGAGEMISSCVYSMMSYSPSRYSHYIIMLKRYKGNHKQQQQQQKHHVIICLSSNTHKYSRCGRPEKASSLIVVKEFEFRSL